MHSGGQSDDDLVLVIRDSLEWHMVLPLSETASDTDILASELPLEGSVQGLVVVHSGSGGGILLEVRREHWVTGVTLTGARVG